MAGDIPDTFNCETPKTRSDFDRVLDHTKTQENHEQRIKALEKSQETLCSDVKTLGLKMDALAADNELRFDGLYKKLNKNQMWLMRGIIAILIGILGLIASIAITAYFGLL